MSSIILHRSFRLQVDIVEKIFYWSKIDKLIGQETDEPPLFEVRWWSNGTSLSLPGQLSFFIYLFSYFFLFPDSFQSQLKHYKWPIVNCTQFTVLKEKVARVGKTKKKKKPRKRATYRLVKASRCSVQTKNAPASVLRDLDVDITLFACCPRVTVWRAAVICWCWAALRNWKKWPLDSIPHIFGLMHAPVHRRTCIQHKTS